MAPEDVTRTQLLTNLQRCVDDDNTNHRKGLHIGLADGSVRWIPHDTPQADLHGFIVINGHAPVPGDF